MRFAPLLVLLGLTSCSAYVGASGVKIPPDSAKQCEAQCNQIGMKLSAVAVMANNIGCVCAAKAEESGQVSSSVADQAASTSAGMATIMMQEQARAEEQQHQANNVR